MTDADTKPKNDNKPKDPEKKKLDDALDKGLEESFPGSSGRNNTPPDADEHINIFINQIDISCRPLRAAVMIHHII